METEYPERYRILGLKIAYYRKKAGYTQESFAEKIGKSHNFIAQVEGPGTTKGVSLETLFKIAETLGVPPSRLLEEDWRQKTARRGGLFSLSSTSPPHGNGCAG